MVAVLAFSAGNSRKSNCGYTQAVDYWSLGVTIFVLLTGSLPFHHDKVAGFLQHLEEQHQNDSGDSATSDHKPAPPDYARWYDKVSKSVSSNRMSNECMSVLTGLLCIDENKRLGGGKDGVKHLKLHPWFSDISWRMLTQKLVVPPQLPSAVQKSVLSATSEDQEENPYSSFVEMLKDLGNSNLRLYGVAAPTPIYQNYFSTW